MGSYFPKMKADENTETTFSLVFSQQDSNNELKWKPYHVFASTGLHNAIIKNTDPCVSLICPRVVICWSLLPLSN